MDQHAPHPADNQLKYRLTLVLVMLLYQHILHAQVNERHFLTMGRIALSEDRNTEAIRNFNTVIQSRPDHFEAWFFRGIAKFNLSDYNGSLADFSETIRLHPLYARAYHYRGIVNDRMANYYDARSDFNKALEIDPYNADLYVAAGATDMHLDNFEKAIRNYDMALLIEPQYAPAWLNRGIARLLLSDTTAAMADFDKAVKHDHFNIEAWMRRGVLRSETGDYSGALADLNEAERLDADNPAVYFQRAHVHLRHGDTLAALNDFEAVNVRDNRNALTYYNRALIHSMRNELPEAKVLYEEVVKINPENIYSHFNLGVVNYQLKDYVSSESNFSNALALFPGFVGAWVNRSLVRKALNDKQGAQADYDHAMGLIQAVNQDGEDPAKLFSKYADSTYFSRIMALDADFVSGNVAGTRPQFRNIDIQPFAMFVVSFERYQKTSDQEKAPKRRTDLMVNQLNAQLDPSLKLEYVNQTQLQAAMETQAEQPRQIPPGMSYAIDQFLHGVLEQSRDNQTRSLTHYGNIPDNDSLAGLSRLNEAVALYEKEISRTMDERYVAAVTIQQGRPVQQKTPGDTQEKLDLEKAIEAASLARKLDDKNAFACFNHAYLLLQNGAFHPAIDAFSDAIARDPGMGEAWYNRALTLLYLNENQLACTDLSKAGENGISEAYAVMYKYCKKPD